MVNVTDTTSKATHMAELLELLKANPEFLNNSPKFKISIYKKLIEMRAIAEFNEPDIKQILNIDDYINIFHDTPSAKPVSNTIRVVEDIDKYTKRFNIII